MIRSVTSHMCVHRSFVWGRVGGGCQRQGGQPEIRPDAETALLLPRILMLEELAWPGRLGCSSELSPFNLAHFSLQMVSSWVWRYQFFAYSTHHVRLARCPLGSIDRHVVSFASNAMEKKVEIYISHVLEQVKFKPTVHGISWNCRGQLDRHGQTKDTRPGTEGHQGKKPQVPSKGQNWENKDSPPG